MPLVDNLVSGFQEGMAVFCGESEFSSYGRQALWLEGSGGGGGADLGYYYWSLYDMLGLPRHLLCSSTTSPVMGLSICLHAKKLRPSKCYLSMVSELISSMFWFQEPSSGYVSCLQVCSSFG